MNPQQLSSLIQEQQEVIRELTLTVSKMAEEIERLKEHTHTVWAGHTGYPM